MAANRSDLGPPTSPGVDFSWNGHEESDFWGPGAVGSQIGEFWVGWGERNAVAPAVLLCFFIIFLGCMCFVWCGLRLRSIGFLRIRSEIIDFTWVFLGFGPNTLIFIRFFESFWPKALIFFMFLKDSGWKPWFSLGFCHFLFFWSLGEVRGGLRGPKKKWKMHV